MKILLEKWGFSNIKKCKPGMSKIKELREFQNYVIENKKYDISDPYVKNNKMLKEKKKFYISGFDKNWSGQLVVEAKKKKHINFSEVVEFSRLKQVRYNSIIDNLKIKIFFRISSIIDIFYNSYRAFKKKIKN